MEKSSFFNSVMNGNRPDRVYLAEDFARYFNSFIGNGVFPNPSTSLQVMANDDMTVTLKAGKGWINGYFYVNTDDLVIPIEMADGLRHRIDRIVLRLDLNNRWVKAVVKKGKLDTNPIPPELQRGDNIYELGLAEVRVGKGDISIGQSQIKDTRASSELCGWVTGVVDQVDTETLFKQYESWYKDTTGKAEADLTSLKEQFKKDIDEFTDNYTNWFANFTGESEKEFNDWFDTIKNTLDDNVASKLLQSIEDLKSTKADKSYVDEKISEIDFTELEKEIDKKADKEYVDNHIVTDKSDTGVKSVTNRNALVASTNARASSGDAGVYSSRDTETNSITSAVIGSWKSQIKDTDPRYIRNMVMLASNEFEFDPSSANDNKVVGGYKGDLSWMLDSRNGEIYAKDEIKIGDMKVKDTIESKSRTSTIVIANYDSKDSSKKGADIVINKGENASEKINEAIQSLKGVGGEVKLMEGNYNLEYGIAVNVDGVHLTGVPKATILVQNTNWKGNPYNNDRKAVIDTWMSSNRDNVDVEISNLYVKGAKVNGSHGFSCSGSSTVNNCISENSGENGFSCSGSSTVNNCISENSGGDGFWCWESSTVNNCISENSGENGFYCDGSSTVNNCVSENSGGDGFWCSNRFEGVCGFNTLIGDKLNDNSSSPAIVQYNIVKEG